MAGENEQHDYTLEVREMTFCRKCLRLKLLGVDRPCDPGRMTPELHARMLAHLVRTAVTRTGRA